MRIEYEGVIEQQPTYSHVGYVSVASTRINREPTAMTGLGLAAIGLMLAIMAYRARAGRIPGSRSTIFGIVGVLMLLGGGILAATNGGVTEKYYRAPYAETGYRLYGLDQSLNAALEADRDLPAELAPLKVAEFQTAGDVDDPNLDAWGSPFRYMRDMPEEFGRPYNVISAGADGAFGTDDDLDLSANVLRGVDYDFATRGEKPWPEKPEPHRYWKVGIEDAD